MGSRRLRLIAAALSWLAAGALAHAADGSARVWVASVILVLTALVLTAPLARGATGSPQVREPTPPPLDAQQLSVLHAQLEHLPVAAWVQSDTQLRPLGNRARRLQAPGGVRDTAALHQLLLTAAHSGPVVLDTERGSERWQLRRQPLTLNGQEQVLLALMPLEHELESESLHAWQQLVQVLTHEIMNSLTPIKSLSETALTLLTDPAAEDDLRTALQAIALRAESLSGFVRTYRRVSQWPAPAMAPVDLQALFDRLQQAVGPVWSKRGGKATFELVSPSLQLQADAGQLEQVLLALITNAAQATQDEATPRLWLQARQGRGGRLQISVRDNGPGVPPGLERQIFLPFFSAREGGQGIGLTVVRQLVFGMGGRVRYVRPLEGGAAFLLSF